MAVTFPDGRGCAVQDVFRSAVDRVGARMAAQVLHRKHRAALVCLAQAAADEWAARAGGHLDAHEKYRAAARDSPSAEDLASPWAVGAPRVEQGLRGARARRPPQPLLAVLQQVIWLQVLQPLVAPVLLRAAWARPRDEWVSAALPVRRASRPPGRLRERGPGPLAQSSELEAPPGAQPRGLLERQAWQQERQVHRQQPVLQLEEPHASEEALGVRQVSFALLSTQLPWLLSPLWQPLPPELLPLQLPESSFLLYRRRRRESNSSGSFFR